MTVQRIHSLVVFLIGMQFITLAVVLAGVLR